MELPVAGALDTGFFTKGILDNPDFTVLGHKVLFAGADVNEIRSLWVTNGTARGTTKLAVPGAEPSGGLRPSRFFDFGSKALFAGRDSRLETNLWVTDGTLGGTHELAVADAGAGGLLSSGDNVNPDFAMLGKKVLFAGNGPEPFVTLWTTDGTSVGTRPLTLAGGTYALFGVEGISDPGFAVLGSKALFAGAGGRRPKPTFG